MYMITDTKTQVNEAIDLINSVSGSLAFMKEYFESNTVTMPHMSGCQTAATLQAAMTLLADAESKLWESADSLERLSAIDTDGTNTLDANKLIDLYLANIDSGGDFDSQIDDKRKIQELMRENQNKRLKQKANLGLVTVTNINEG